LPEDGWIGGERPDVQGRPYLLHFWATWCGPCKNDLPILKGWADDGALVIGMHPAGTPADEVAKAVEESELDYPTFLETGQDSKTIAGYLKVGFPYCVLIDAQGNVAAHGFLLHKDRAIPTRFRELREAPMEDRKAAQPSAAPGQLATEGAVFSGTNGAGEDTSTDSTASAMSDDSDETSEPLQQLQKVWRERTRRFQHARFVFTETDQRRTAQVLPDGRVEFEPESFGVHETRYNLLFSGRKVRIQSSRDVASAPAADQQNADRKRQETVLVFDGSEARGITHHPDYEYPQGSVSNQQAPDPSGITYRPVLMTCRMLDPHLQPFSIDDYHIVDTAAELDGLDVWKLESRRKVSGGRSESVERESVETLWLDPQREFVVLRRERTVQGNSTPRSQMRISYIDDSEFGPVANAWSYARYASDGSTQSYLLGRMTRYEVDPPIDAGEFELEFPPGTRYLKHENAGSDRQFIVRNDKTHREITLEELRRGATQQELMSTEPGKAGLNRD
jgi:thiol-disulfide isomerase/thioredoxin